MGCHNDIETLHTLITEKYGFPSENAKILRDDDENNMPTRENIENAISWLVDGAKEGDTLFFQFSGHGGQVPDADGDEEDAKDETIIPCDYQSAGQITDDQLFEMLVKPLPKGVTMTVIMDCCHSGTGMDLSFIHKIDTTASRDAGKLVFDGFVEKKLKKKKDKKKKDDDDEDEDKDKKNDDDDEDDEDEDEDKDKKKKKKKKKDDDDDDDEDEDKEKKKKKKKKDDDDDEDEDEDEDEEKKKKKKKKDEDDEDEDEDEDKDKKKKKKKDDDDEDEDEDEDKEMKKKKKGNDEEKKKKKKSKKSKKSKKNYDDTSDANVIMLSGCMDHQTSADAHIDGQHTGAMTYALKTELENTAGNCSYKELVASMYEVLNQGNYTQVPQLSTARPFDLESKFAL